MPRTPTHFRPISMQNNITTQLIHNDDAIPYPGDNSFTCSNDHMESVPQGLVQARSKAFEQIANSSNHYEMSRNGNSSVNQHSQSFNKGVCNPNNLTPGHMRSSQTLDTLSNVYYTEGKSANDFHNGKQLAKTSSNNGTANTNQTTTHSRNYEHRSRAKHVL